MRPIRLYINVDHVATVRQARRGDEPDPVEAARICEDAGADGITAHLREDRRHIQDHDIELLAKRVRTALNLEMAMTDEMLDIAIGVLPFEVSIVPEKRAEVTTEGGLDVTHDPKRLSRGISQMKASGIRASLFINPDERMVRASVDVGADAIELHTGAYAHHPKDSATLAALAKSAELGAKLGLAVHAGHGLSVSNVRPVAAIAEIEELNIGHAVVSRAIFVGLGDAVKELRRVMDSARESS